jgi:hypothetical protein
MRRPGPPARRQRQTLEALVVLPAAVRIERIGRGCARAWIVGREVVLALALGDERLGRPDRRQQAAGGREAVEVGPVFVADEETSVRQQHQRFAIDADAAVRRLRQIREAVGGATDAALRRIEPTKRLACRVGEQDGVEKRRHDVGLVRRRRSRQRP